ncbi:Crp/Fnr family transcriptional regulator [bacterium]|nr:Crp/Fnr family transcriptional regulator [bacterium]
MTVIKLQTAKTDLSSLIEGDSLLKDSLFISYLNQEARDYFYSHITPLIVPQGKMLVPEQEAGRLFFLLSGKFFMIYHKKSVQKLFSTLKKGDFFSMRKDFGNIIFYCEEKALCAVISKEHLFECFQKSPQTKELVKDFLYSTHQRIQKYE